MRIAVVTHEHDRFVRRSLLRGRWSYYLLYDLLRVLEERGHGVRVVRGLGSTVEADAAIAHVDCSRTPEAYRDFVGSFPVSVNGDVADITKRAVSGALLERGTDWEGPVILKSDLNYRGIPERRHNESAERDGRDPPHPGAVEVDGYRVLDAVSEVPDRCWESDAWVVERFVPEADPEGHAMRTWVFAGQADRCLRHVAPEPLVKAEDIVRSEPVPVPEELRAERDRLGFDFGKFDYVVHDGRAILLDANKTPGTRPSLRRAVREGASPLPDGLEGMLV